MIPSTIFFSMAYILLTTTKIKKRNFRRKALNNYEVKKGLLYYHQISKQVPRSSKDKQRIVNACHSSAEG